MEVPSMEELIKSCEKKQRPDEQIVFAFGVGRMIDIGMSRKMKRMMKEGLDFIKKQDGFLGVHPIDLWHNLLIFDTLNNAKIALNNLKGKGVSVGRIAPILVEKKYIK